MNKSYDIERIAASLNYDEAETQHFKLGLELAVALGPEVGVKLWMLACEAAGVAAREEWIDALVGHDLAQRFDNTWRFSDPDFADAIEQYARVKGRWRAHNIACAQALDRRDADDRRVSALRRSAHLEVAGRIEAAIEALFDAADDAFDNGDFPGVRRIFTRADELITKASSTSAVLVARLDWRRARVAEVSGDWRTALELVGRALDELSDSDYISECGHGCMIRARVLRREGRLVEAVETYRRAGQYFAMCGDEEGLALSRGGQGMALMLDGQPSLAREQFFKSMFALDAIGFHGTACELRSSVAQSWLLEGNTSQARLYAKQALETAVQHEFFSHQAMAWNVLGEIARSECDYELAFDCYRKSVHLYECADNLNVYIARSNLALVEVARGRFALARGLLETLAVELVEVGLQSRLSPIYFGLMACAAAEQDWQAWKSNRDDVASWLEQREETDADLAWTARLASEAARAQGRCDLGDDVIALIEHVAAEG